MQRHAPRVLGHYKTALIEVIGPLRAVACGGDGGAKWYADNDNYDDVLILSKATLAKMDSKKFDSRVLKLRKASWGS
jgi:hypothetical protein